MQQRCSGGLVSSQGLSGIAAGRQQVPAGAHATPCAAPPCTKCVPVPYATPMVFTLR